MSNFGQFIHINLFGESHGHAVGITISNLPPGLEIDLDRINADLLKRRPKSNLSTPRQEQDHYKIISGYFNKKTTGTPLTILIPNKDTKSKDYNPDVLRPSHSDFTAYERYKGFQDYRGGGHFSGRLTAPLVILGSICSQILESKGIVIGSHISSIGKRNDAKFEDVNVSKELLKTLLSSDFPLIDSQNIEHFKAIILEASKNQDSVGGTIETAILGLKPGLGAPYFDSVEGLLGKILFSIPAVKGVEFGKGFDITQLFGSEANDPFIMENGLIKTSSNNSGGIQGGITNGMPITFRIAIKPTSSIGLEQQTINYKTKEEITHTVDGRHDPCIVHRVIHVVNALTAYAILELNLRNEGYSWIL